MVLSMTSYGRASAEIGNLNLVVEIKTLNSKFIDLRLKLPANLNEQEMWMRKVFQDQLQRGKVETSIVYENNNGADLYKINKALFKSYHGQLSALRDELGLTQENLFEAIVRMPEIVSAEEGSLSKADVDAFHKVVQQALEQVQQHRRHEGESIEHALRAYVNEISSQLKLVDPHEKKRVEMIRSKMSNNLQEFMKKDSVDENRFEQEVIFYMEKIDITEEKVRLKQHCEYFIEVLEEAGDMKGRKLSFISQEMGREINTLGAKSYSSDLQKIVVLMKDELEKIKEQLANVL